MADELISRQAVVAWLKKLGRFWKCCENTKHMRKTLGGIINHIEKMSAVDAVEVVRCAQCIYSNSCEIEGMLIGDGIENPYCSGGERRIDDGT